MPINIPFDTIHGTGVKLAVVREADPNSVSFARISPLNLFPTAPDSTLSGSSPPSSPREDLMSVEIELLQTNKDLSKQNNQYSLAADKVLDKDGSFHYAIPELKGNLMALRGAYENNYLSEIGELINADIFSDILEQSEYLHSQDYVRASVVAAGVSLESHLGKLAVKNDIPVGNSGNYVRAARLNAELVSKEVYEKTLQKSITRWLGLLNDAAHPYSKEINIGLIEPMIMGIRNLIEKYPA